MKLIIAEKPIAAERIASILGKPKHIKKNGIDCYALDGTIIVPLKGHILNVDFSKDYKSWASTDLKDLIKADILYEPLQPNIIQTLKEFAPACDELEVATDYDNEGESIGKEAITIVKEINPNIGIKRARFSAITPEEIKEAFAKPTEFDYNLADSADARREVDLIWGAVLTRFISLTGRRFGRDFLSVGRVQTPTLALVVDREKEIQKFKPKPFWVVSILCDKDGKQFYAIYEKDKISNKKEAQELGKLKANEAGIKDVKKKQLKLKPPTPFNTTDYLVAASSLGLQPQMAMRLAESLYMAGYTSYPRTDNTVYPATINLKSILKKFESSPEFGGLAKKLLQKKKLTPTKGKKQTTDHPPIYPVEVADKNKLSAIEWKVYELIVRRFFATLSENAVLDTVKVTLDYSSKNFIARGKTITKQGWREFYPYSTTEEIIIPELKENETVKVDKLETKEDKTKPKPRWTQAALIKEMETLGLGTKSTRAEILQKIMDRGYVQGKQNFTPSKVAFVVIDSLEKYVSDITKPDMTSKLEAEMEEIAEGQKKKEDIVQESRDILETVVSRLEKNKLQIGEQLLKAKWEENILGSCPNCKDGKLRIIYTKRKTRFVGCTSYPNCKTGFPLPAKGKILILRLNCMTCGMPMIKVIYAGKRPFDMCIKPDCESKKNWGKRSKEKSKKK
jgi:DNA topoisomerase-1